MQFSPRKYNLVRQNTIKSIKMTFLVRQKDRADIFTSTI
jgi:hypothetical protein